MAQDTIPMARRAELLFSPLDDCGEYVVKDPRSGAYFKLGAEGYFLLSQLDGSQTCAAIRTAFQHRFGEPLSEEDLQAFVELARTQSLLQTAEEQPERPRQSLLA